MKKWGSEKKVKKNCGLLLRYEIISVYELHLNVIGHPADNFGYDEAGEIRGWGSSRPSPEPAHPAAPAGVHGSVQSLCGETQRLFRP